MASHVEPPLPDNLGTAKAFAFNFSYLAELATALWGYLYIGAF